MADIFVSFIRVHQITQPFCEPGFIAAVYKLIVHSDSNMSWSVISYIVFFYNQVWKKKSPPFHEHRDCGQWIFVGVCDFICGVCFPKNFDRIRLFCGTSNQCSR